MTATRKPDTAGARHGEAPAAAVRLAQVECEARLEAGQPMAAIDGYVDRLPLDERRRDAVRLHAWAYGTRIPPR